MVSESSLVVSNTLILDSFYPTKRYFPLKSIDLLLPFSYFEDSMNLEQHPDFRADYTESIQAPE